MSDTILRIENLGKKFFLGHQTNGNLRQTFVQGIKAWLRPDSHTIEEFWALRNFDLEVRRGEVVGIIGKNGAGKSTLLKTLSRISYPTTGRFEIDGRVSSLLEVGTGFHGELTGRENIFLNGTILGMRRGEVRKKFDEIVAFSGVENFLDTPVKHYSSGMRVRLAFSVAAHLEPEVLIIDEVLAVGDAEFQNKCLGKMNEVSKKEGRTVLFVSHNMAAVETLCTRGIIMHDGMIQRDGTVTECIAEYARTISASSGTMTWRKAELEMEKPMEVLTCDVELRGSQPNHELIVKTLLKSNDAHRNAFIAYDLRFEDDSPVFQAIPTDKPFIPFRNEPQVIASAINLPPLIPGDYKLSVWVGPHYAETFDWQQDIVSFRIESSPMANRTHPHSKRNGFLVPTSSVIL